MRPLGYLAISLMCAGCGGWTPSNGVRPKPAGVARVWLAVDGRHATALRCYDPMWVELRGPWDCLDLVPPGAQIGPGEVVGRGPGDGAPRLALSAEGSGRWLWVEGQGARPAPEPVDLNGDGRVDGPASGPLRTPAGPP